MTNCDPCKPEFPTPRDEWGFRIGDPWDVEPGAVERVRVLVLDPAPPPPAVRRFPGEHAPGVRA
jgi:hypothetical protein